MALYEHVFIARQDVSATQIESLIADFTNIVEAQGGSVKGHEYWGLKTMAYRIKKNRKGHYVMMNIDAQSAAIDELERNLRLHEDILRHLTLRIDAFEEGPSVMMQGKRDGDRRGPRSDRRDDRPARSDEGDRGAAGANAKEKQADAAKGAEDEKAAKPTEDKPAAEPTEDKPAAEPTEDKPATEPTEDKPAAEPVAEPAKDDAAAGEKEKE